jgi:hypothetical protein
MANETTPATRILNRSTGRNILLTCDPDVISGLGVGTWR